MLSVYKLKKYFPLTNINDILTLFDNLLSTSKHGSSCDPDIAFVSILLGLIEYKLTHTGDDDENHCENIFINNTDGYASAKILFITFNDVISLYKKFNCILTDIVISKSPKNEDNKVLDRCNLKSITDAVYLKLSAGKYKENCHSQSIYSFIQDNSLDSFGLSYTILAITQHLGYKNVWLSLSEDHAWLEFEGYDVNNNHGTITDSSHKLTADVAWSGKNHEDKRCGSIDFGILERSRLYLGGNSVVCNNNRMTVTAAITTINPVKGSHSLSLNGYSNRNQIITSYHSSELAYLKRDLLWIAHKMNLLEKYPLALINLADLEMNYPKNTLNKSGGCFSGLLGLYKEAIDINVKYYNNSHVYPYLSMANYFYKDGDFQRALTCWRLAANVISKYNYKSEDWIIYREFFEIATQFVPNIFKLNNKEDDHHSKSSGSVNHASENESTKDRNKMSTDSKSLSCDELKNSIEFLSEFLCFFDFICLWEEGSSVPVLHEVWANKFKEVLCRFSESTRIELNTVGVDANILNDIQSIDEILSLPSGNSKLCINDQPKQIKNDSKQKSFIKIRQNSPNKSKRKPVKRLSLSNEDINQIKEFWLALGSNETKNLSTILSSRVLNLDFLLNSNSVKIFELSNILEPIDYENLNCENLCQLKMDQGFIDYFQTFKSVRDILNDNIDRNNFNSNLKSNESDQVLQELSNDQSHRAIKYENSSSVQTIILETKLETETETNSKRSFITDNKCSHKILLNDILKSQKMKDICPLIVAPGKLNVPAIKLPLTAQSQVSLKRTGLHSVYGSFEFSNTMSRKRVKRE